MYGAGFKYRKLHYIEGSSAGAQTNYPVAIKVYDGAGTDATDSVYLNNLARSGVPDIRFTTLNGTPCPYWIEHPAYTGYQLVWVKIPSIPVGGTAIYILFGNDVCISASNGDSTFDFFDDFEGSALDTTKWTSTNFTNVISGGIAQGTVNHADGGTYETKSSFPVGTAIRHRIKYNSATGSYNQFGYQNTINSFMAVGLFDDVSLYGYFTSKKATSSSGTININTLKSDWENYNIWDMKRLSTSLDIYLNGAFKIQFTDLDHIPTVVLPLQIVGYPITRVQYIDWTLVRKYISPEPAHGIWGSLETSLQGTPKAYDQRGDPQ